MNYKEIMALPEPTSQDALISCKVTGIVAKNEDRNYYIKRGTYRCYRAIYSARQGHWFQDGAQPQGDGWEATDNVRTYYMTEGRGYIGHFADWQAITQFLCLMRATHIQVLEG